MLSVILSLALPALFSGLILCVPKPAEPQKTKDKKSKKKPAPASNPPPVNKNKLAIFSAVCICLFLILHFISVGFMAGGGHIPFIAEFLYFALAYGSFACKTFVKDERKVRFMKNAAVCAAAVLAAEVLVFNGKSLTTDNSVQVFTGSQLLITGEYAIDGDTVTMTGNTEVYLNDVPSFAGGLVIDARQEKNLSCLPYLCEIGMEDQNFPASYITTSSRYLQSVSRDADFSFKPYGDIISLRIRFSDMKQPVTFTSVKVLPAVPFSFNIARFLVLLALCIAVSAVRAFSLWRISYDRRKLSHIIMAQVMVILCTLMAFSFFKPDQELTPYDPAAKSIGDPYYMTFDAFQHGQVSLDYEAEPGLSDLEYIYNWGARSDSGLFYLWDYAYHDGKYYVYFGTAPTLTLYYPVYLLTGKLPNLPITNDWFCTLAVIFMCEMLLAATKILAPKPNFLMLLMSMPVATACVGVFRVMNYSDIYCVPMSAGLAYLFLCLWLAFCALGRSKKWQRITLLCLSGIALVLAVASRPGMALSGAVLIPLFLGILFNKKCSLKDKLSQAAAFVVPLVIGACGIMAYNNARFGSPLDFGAAYQLTVSDINANKIYLSSLPEAIFPYFLAPARVASHFPFFEYTSVGLANYGHYVYIMDYVSAFTYPIVIAGLLLLPVIIRRKSRTSRYGITSLQVNAFYAVSLVMAVFIAWQDFCLGGVIATYIIDIMPLLLIASLLPMIRYFSARPGKKLYLYSTFAAVMALSFGIGWLVNFSYLRGCVNLKCPDLMDSLEDMLIFWQ